MRKNSISSSEKKDNASPIPTQSNTNTSPKLLRSNSYPQLAIKINNSLAKNVKELNNSFKKVDLNETEEKEITEVTTSFDSPRNMGESDELFIPAYCVGYTSDETNKSSPKNKGKHKKVTNKAKNYVTSSSIVSEKNTRHLDVDRNWQNKKTTLKERLAYMFNNDLMADVNFVMIGEKDASSPLMVIPAHKFVLSISSSVFDTMFNGQLSDQSGKLETIHITDIEPAAFLNLMKFFYTDQVTLCPETVMATLYAAKKYAANVLEFACVDYLEKNLSGDNACMLLAQARLFDEPQLTTLCLEVIDHSTLEAISAESFTEIDNETLCIILQRDSLELREMSLYTATLKWAEAECVRKSLSTTTENLHLVLGKALSLLRFPLMSVEEFASGPAQSGLLSDRDVVQMFLYFTARPRPESKFSVVPRNSTIGKEECVCRFMKVEKRWGYSGHCDRIVFIVNRKIYLTGVGLYGSIYPGGKYIANLQVIDSEYHAVLGSKDAAYTSNGATSTIKVSFKEPIEICANISYTICATIQGPDSYFGSKGVRKVVSGKTTFQFFYNSGDNNGTSVEDGQLPELYYYT